MLLDLFIYVTHSSINHTGLVDIRLTTTSLAHTSAPATVSTGTIDQHVPVETLVRIHLTLLFNGAISDVSETSMWPLLIRHDSMILLQKQLMQNRALEHIDHHRAGLETAPLYTGAYRPSQSWSGDSSNIDLQNSLDTNVY